MMTVEDALDIADNAVANSENNLNVNPEDTAVIVLAAEVRRLREENERLRKDAAVGAAIQRAAAELPVGDMIEITVDKGSAMVVIYYDDGGWETMDIDGDNRLASEINAAIDAARGAK